MEALSATMEKLGISTSETEVASLEADQGREGEQYRSASRANLTGRCPPKLTAARKRHARWLSMLDSLYCADTTAELSEGRSIWRVTAFCNVPLPYENTACFYSPLSPPPKSNTDKAVQ